MVVEDYFVTHPSGVGAYINVPAHVPYKVFRSDLKSGLDGTPGLILQGISPPDTRFLDFDLPIGKTVTYRMEVNGKAYEREITADPENTYSSVNDADMEDAPNPRDALVIYYATRLANLVKNNRLVVYLKDGQVESNHAKKYSVRTEFQFQKAELPILVLDYIGGEAHGLDLGHTMTESPFRIEGFFAATSREERDSARQAIIGLWRDTEWFLEDIGAYEADLINLANGMQGDEPPFFTLEFSIVGVFAFDQSARERVWEMLNLVNWI